MLRFNARIKIKNWTFFGMISKTQTVEGFTSLIKNVGDVYNNIHIGMWDLDGCSLDEAIYALEYVRDKYNLGEIFIVGENPKMQSFRAWCFQPMTFRVLLAVINDTEYVDYLFFKYTVLRGKATLRISKKENRPEQNILYKIEGKSYPIPKYMEMVIYDTSFIRDRKEFVLEI